MTGSPDHPTTPSIHESVMPREVLQYLAPHKDGVYVDATLGGGGHAEQILRVSGPSGRLIGIDFDETAIGKAGARLRGYKDRVEIVRDNFRNIKKILGNLNIDAVDGIVADVGVSSFHLEDRGRGFSFRCNERLDMRMDTRVERSAFEFVNELPAGELAGIFKRFGEERFSMRVARAIEKRRAGKAIETTGELAAIVANAIPRKFHSDKIDPATKVFQALRIAVNSELENLEQGLNDGFEMLRKGARMVVISFHSLEDRLVKKTFQRFSSPCICPADFPHCVCGRKPTARIITKKIITAGPDELQRNPRSRSAKLRAAERL